ncbi:MAG: (p)ppGpp synthetase, partial [Oscillospiraceae bacterium]|nr:(p)ppGpp synthetase [Oscillospiraceae bacterium]
IVRGRAMLEQELKKTGLSIAAISTEELLPHILKKVRFNSLDDLYAAIGYGRMPTVKAVNRVRDEMIRQGQQVRDTAHRSQPK